MPEYCEPNLPKSRVKQVFVSQIMPEAIINELNDMGISAIKLGKSANLISELAYHPDILVNNFRKGMWICENDAKYLPKEVDKSIFYESETELFHLYPKDCPFNNFRIGKLLICGMSADYLIRAYAEYDECRIINVQQNYAKCCSIPVTENAIITCDYYIGRALRKNGFDVLTLQDSDTIGLRGYSHGLIGGCAGKLSNDLIGFTGNLNLYEYADDVRDFCKNHKVDVISLSSEPMYDYGGILPITEVGFR